PLEAGQLGRFPAWCVQARHLLEHRGRGARITGGDLVALNPAGDVLEQKGEPARLGFDFGDVGPRDAGLDAWGDLTVEADLDLVGPQGETGGAALVVGRGELAHDGGRTRVRWIEGQREARGVG